MPKESPSLKINVNLTVEFTGRVNYPTIYRSINGKCQKAVKVDFFESEIYQGFHHPFDWDRTWLYRVEARKEPKSGGTIYSQNVSVPKLDFEQS